MKKMIPQAGNINNQDCKKGIGHDPEPEGTNPDQDVGHRREPDAFDESTRDEGERDEEEEDQIGRL